jgi:hypothetical protein
MLVVRRSVVVLCIRAGVGGKVRMALLWVRRLFEHGEV